MSKILLLLSLLGLFRSSMVFSQHKIDSLLNLLGTQTADDKKASIYAKLSIAYSGQRKLDLARKYADTLMALSQKLNLEEGIQEARLCYAECDRYEGNYKQAIDNLEIYNAYYQKKGDSSKLADGLYQSAVVYRLMGDYKKSLPYFFRVLKISELDADSSGIATQLNSIGIVYKNLKQYDQAIESYQKALYIFHNLRSTKNEAMVLNSLGSVYSDKKDYQLAKSYFEKSLELILQTGIKQRIGYAYSNLGSTCWQLGEYEMALDYHMKALAIREKLGEKEELAFTYRNLGVTYIKLKKYQLGFIYLQKSLDLAKSIEANPLIQDIYLSLSDISAEQHDYKQAYQYHKLYSDLKDSILNKETTFQILELKTKFETAEKDNQIAILAKEKQVQQKEAERQATLKKVFIGGFILIALLAILIIYIYRQRLISQKVIAAKNEEIRNISFQKQFSELEMKALRAQINPHFLFNCMNSINTMIINGENEEASQYLTKFSKLMRLILENAEASSVSIESELALLESYIQLEKLRFKGKINYRIDVEKEIDIEEACIPSMILQPFVENSIWHGLLHKTGADEGLVDISVKENNGRIICTIEDNGVGREKARELYEKTMYKSKSMGIKITEERLRLLSKEPSGELIKITDLKDLNNNALGTRVEIHIPVND